FKPLALDMQLVLISAIALQLILICLGLQPMIRSAKVIHTLAPILYSAQPLLPSAVLRTKLQVMTYYEINHAKNKITYTLGPLGKITNSSLFEVFILVIPS